jgi:hypothetical protein
VPSLKFHQHPTKDSAVDGQKVTKWLSNVLELERADRRMKVHNNRKDIDGITVDLTALVLRKCVHIKGHTSELHLPTFA